MRSRLSAHPTAEVATTTTVTNGSGSYSGDVCSWWGNKRIECLRGRVAILLGPAAPANAEILPASNAGGPDAQNPSNMHVATKQQLIRLTQVITTPRLVAALSIAWGSQLITDRHGSAMKGARLYAEAGFDCPPRTRAAEGIPASGRRGCCPPKSAQFNFLKGV